MDILIVGSGGREHALAWKVAQSSTVQRVFVAPGNAGTHLEPRITNVPIEVEALDQLLHFARTQSIDLTIVGPEVPLVLGIVDAFRAAGLNCLGPDREAAQLEGSKAFAKKFLIRHGIQTAGYAIFTELEPALVHLRSVQFPIVIKADGLAAGKGVILAADLAAAETAVQGMLAQRRFGSAGEQIIIEEFLQGEEVSFIALVDGTHVLPLASSQDHKAIGEGDTGPNTGGMGAYSPAFVLTPKLHQQVMEDIMLPTVRGMAADGRPYTGFLYAGLMIGADNVPKVLEFNCRCGDPETQPIMLRLRSDLVELCMAAIAGRLDQITADWDPQIAVGVVLAAGGYPERYARGHVITGLPQGPMLESKVFHAGTALREDGKIITNGGRVLCVTALGSTVTEAQSRAYALVDTIHWPDQYYRKDIGYRAKVREQTTVHVII
jgi:phosphoribosylamine--glycine ligase